MTTLNSETVTEIAKEAADSQCEDLHIPCDFRDVWIRCNAAALSAISEALSCARSVTEGETPDDWGGVL